MGFGNFLKKLTMSPFKATGQALHGNFGQAFKTGITGGGTAPFASKAPFLGGGAEAAPYTPEAPAMETAPGPGAGMRRAIDMARRRQELVQSMKSRLG